MKKYILLLLILSFTMSCKTKTVANQPVNTNAALVSNTVFFNSIKSKPDFQQLKINSRVSVESGSFIPPLDATIYIENGKKVWMNMTAIFLNVGRGLATPEGIKGYEKWNKTYINPIFLTLIN